MEIIGYISQAVIDTLDLCIKPNTPVFIGDANIEHIKNRHPYEYDKYYDDISTIINSPDYVGINPKDASILFVRLYEICSHADARWNLPRGRAYPWKTDNRIDEKGSSGHKKKRYELEGLRRLQLWTGSADTCGSR